MGNIKTGSVSQTLEIEVEDYRIPELEAVLSRVNRREQRLGLEPSRMQVSDSFRMVFEYLGPTGGSLWQERTSDPRVRWTGRARCLRRVTFTMPQVRVPGFELHAAIDHLREGVVVRLCPGAEPLPEGFRQGKSWCDHCEKERNRKTTYVLRSVADGSLTRVGASCLQDFLGEKAARAFSFFSAWREAFQLGDSNSGGSSWFENEEYLAWVCLAMRECGWVSRTQARYDDRRSTSQAAWDMMAEMDPRYRKEPSEEDRDLARQSLAWAREISDTDSSEYLQNLRALALQGAFEIGRHAGLVASIPMAYQKARQKEIEAERRRQEMQEVDNNWMGKVGEKITDLEVVLVRQREIVGYYGSTLMCGFETPKGAQIVWFCSGRFPEGIKVGDRCTIVSATVKKHDEYKGRRQTQITRARVIKMEGKSDVGCELR